MEMALSKAVANASTSLLKAKINWFALGLIGRLNPWLRNYIKAASHEIGTLERPLGIGSVLS